MKNHLLIISKAAWLFVKNFCCIQFILIWSLAIWLGILLNLELSMHLLNFIWRHHLARSYCIQLLIRKVVVKIELREAFGSFNGYIIHIINLLCKFSYLPILIIALLSGFLSLRLLLTLILVLFLTDLLLLLWLLLLKCNIRAYFSLWFDWLCILFINIRFFPLNHNFWEWVFRMLWGKLGCWMSLLWLHIDRVVIILLICLVDVQFDRIAYNFRKLVTIRDNLLEEILVVFLQPLVL